MNVVEVEVLGQHVDQLGGFMPGVTNVLTMNFLRADPVTNDEVLRSIILNNSEDFLGDLLGKVHPLLKGSTPVVVSVVRVLGEKFLKEVVVSPMDFNPVVAAVNGPLGCSPKVLDDLPDLIFS